MPDSQPAQQFLDACTVDAEVFALRPDYRAGLLVVEGIASGAHAAIADELIDTAEVHARELLAETPVEDLPHVAAWREAYRAFGAKPQRTRHSLEALLRRAEQGLPRVNPLTDIYNAISVLHQVPLGGENFSGYRGPARLVRAGGDEDFDTVSGGEPTIEHPKPGEVVWRDDLAVTCRRWNWRQGRRTALSDDTTSALFILDALAPMTDEALTTAMDELTKALAELGARAEGSRVLRAAGV